jgi:hypothetical protein
MMSENIARNMYSSQGIINYPTQLHLVGHFLKLTQAVISFFESPDFSSTHVHRDKCYILNSFMNCNQNRDQYTITIIIIIINFLSIYKNI